MVGAPSPGLGVHPGTAERDRRTDPWWVVIPILAIMIAGIIVLLLAAAERAEERLAAREEEERMARILRQTRSVAESAVGRPRGQVLPLRPRPPRGGDP